LHSGRWQAELVDALQDRCEQLARRRNFGHLERYAPGMPDRLGSDLEQAAKPPSGFVVHENTLPGTRFRAGLESAARCRRGDLALVTFVRSMGRWTPVLR